LSLRDNVEIWIGRTHFIAKHNLELIEHPLSHWGRVREGDSQPESGQAKWQKSTK
jgi:hypothetical protein